MDADDGRWATTSHVDDGDGTDDRVGRKESHGARSIRPSTASVRRDVPSHVVHVAPPSLSLRPLPGRLGAITCLSPRVGDRMTWTREAI